MIQRGDKMYFGAEFFDCDPDLNTDFYAGFISFFGENNLEIPDNLFDLGVPAVFGLQNFEDLENYNLFFYFRDNFFIDSLSNSFGSSFFSLESFKNNLFYSRNMTRQFNESSDLFNFISGNFFDLNFFRSSFASGFTGFINSYNSEISKGFRSLDLTRFLAGNFFEGIYFYRKFSESIKKFLNFPELISRDIEKNIDFSGAYSEKINELINFLPVRIFDFNRTLRSINSDHQTEETMLNKNKIIIPKNIFSVAAENEFSEFSIRNYSGKINSDNSRSGLNRRIEQLEEIIRNNKRTIEIDYDSVVRRLDFELRSALNSCSEGVHF